MFAIPSAPVKQKVSETITTLSGRLSSATLLEDRRAAILGLRSFAKDFPASVASGALRSLIGSLSNDGEDVDTVKVVLETLLMLFNPNEESPEASDEIVLWLADEFTQRQQNVTLLLDFVESQDFYSRLYSLQLLSAILAARTERTEECVFTAPLGISRLVAVLDDRRDAVRNEAITLLTYLTPTSPDIQKLVAFENAFDRIFAIITAEGSLIEGGRAVEDCLILLANLLRRNTSNQNLFRESGCIPRLADLLELTYKQPDQDAEVAHWAQAQANRNIYALLAVLRLFLTPGSVGTVQNQAAFWQHGLLFHALQLSFSREAQVQIKAEALLTCADVIRGNSGLQESFAQLQVPSPVEMPTEDRSLKANGTAGVYVIDGLLDLALSASAMQAFDLRLAACECLKAYFFNHADVRLHFLKRAIEGHKSGVDETANVLTVLLRPSAEVSASDPYRQWFAAVITFHLLFDNPTAKALALAVTEGDASTGEEVVTSIQTITAHLIAGLNRDEDARILVGYLILLLGWLFEDMDAVNDFLGEGSNVQSMIQAIALSRTGGEMVQGLCAMLLGTVYEFSTKDSPIPRAALQGLLMSRVSRDRYLDKLAKLRSNPLIRDFEVIPQKLDPSGKLPDVFFDDTFVNFFKDNYSRINRAIDRDPGMEISIVTNGVQKGISRELVDSLRGQVEEKDRALQEAQARLASLSRQLDQEQAEHRRTRDGGVIEVSRIKMTYETLQRRHEEELHKLQQTHQQTTRQRDEEYKKELAQARRLAESDAERLHRRTEAGMADLRATISRLEVDLMKANKSRIHEVQAAKEEFAAEVAEQAALVAKAEERARGLEKKLQEANEKVDNAQAAVHEAQEGRKTAQGELDDLLMVFGDLEDKVARYKHRLVALGETVSDGEDDGDDGEDEDDVD